MPFSYGGSVFVLYFLSSSFCIVGETWFRWCFVDRSIDRTLPVFTLTISPVSNLFCFVLFVCLNFMRSTTSHRVLPAPIGRTASRSHCDDLLVVVRTFSIAAVAIVT